MGAFVDSEAIYFHGQSDTLTTFGRSLPNVIFWKHADYLIADDLTATEVHGWLYSTVRGNNITINTDEFSLGNRILNSVTINLIGNYYDFGGTTISYTGNTTFNFTAVTGAVSVRRQKEYAYSTSVYLPNVYSYGIRLEFNGLETFVMGDLELLGDAEFRVPATHVNGSMANYSGKMILHAGNTCEINSIEIADTLIAKGTCNEIITIRPYGSSTGYIQMGGTDVESCFIQGMNNTGTTAPTNVCIDGGSNTGWIFNSGAGVVYYWRASATNATDFTGNWSDPNHWTTDPNSVQGSLGGCMPTLADTVVFDNMSFSPTSNGCNIDNTAFCKTFLCVADITITGDELYVGGSFLLDENMSNYNQTGNIYFVGAGINTINLNNTILANCGVVFNNAGGEWVLTNDFYLHDSVYQCYTGFVLDAGTFRTDGYTLTIQSRFRADRTTSYRVLDMRNSTVNLLCNDRYNTYYGLTWDISTSTGMQILSDNSTLNFMNNTTAYAFTKYFYMGDGLVYDRVNFLDNDDYMRVYNDATYGYAAFDGTTTIYGNNTFDSVSLVGGHKWYITGGKTQTLAPEHGKLISYGNSSDFVYIESTTAQDAYIHKEYGNAFCVDYVKIKDIQATKGASDPVIPGRHIALFFETGENSDNINNSATGIWAFSLPPAVNIETNHDTLFHFCNGGGNEISVPITFTGTYPYNVLLSWYDDLGNSGLDTFYFLDDDNDVSTVCTHYIDLDPVSSSYYTIDAAGLRCGERNFNAPLSYINVLLDKGILVDQQSMGECNLTNEAYFTHFFDVSTQRPIASIQDQANGTDTVSMGFVQAKAYFDATPPYMNGKPYLQRHWLLEPTNEGPGKVRLYFTQTELTTLSLTFSGGPGMTLQDHVNLIQFPDTIGVGVPDTLAFTVITLGGASATPFTTLNDVVAIEFETSSVGAYMLQTKTIPAIFPLDLLAFEVQKEGNYAGQIAWTTAQEVDIDEFVIERSTDAIEFKAVERVSAQLGLDYNYYNVIDAYPNIPMSYYRLKIVETDGSFYYSPIRSLRFEKPIEDVKLIPNPSNEAVQIILNTTNDADFLMEVYNISGQKIMERGVEGNKGVHKITLETSEWGEGIYLVRLASFDGGVSTHKLMVQH